MTKATYGKESLFWIMSQRDESILVGRHSGKALWQGQKAASSHLSGKHNAERRNSEWQRALESQCDSSKAVSPKPPEQCHHTGTTCSNISYSMSPKGDVIIQSMAAPYHDSLLRKVQRDK